MVFYQPDVMGYNDNARRGRNIYYPASDKPFKIYCAYINAVNGVAGSGAC